MSSDLFLLG